MKEETLTRWRPLLLLLGALAGVGLAEGAGAAAPASQAGRVGARPEAAAAPLTGKSGQPSWAILAEKVAGSPAGSPIKGVASGVTGVKAAAGARGDWLELSAASNAVAGIVVEGEASGPLKAVVGEQQLVLKGDGPQVVVLTNGARVELGLNTVARSLEWRVEQGCFEFSVAGIAGWRWLGLSGQAGLLQWDVASRTVSLNNVTPTGGAWSSITTSPGPDVFVALGAESGAEVSELGASGAFALTAYGEEVSLYNAATGRETALGMKSVVFLGRSVPAAGSLAKSGATWVSVGGDGKQMTLRGEWGVAKLRPGQWKDLPGAGAAKVEATLNRNGELTLRSVGGRALVFSQVDARLGVQLEAGNAVRMGVDTAQGTATVSGVAGNQPRGAVFALIGQGGVVTGWPEKGAVEPAVERPMSIKVERSGESATPVATLAWCEAKAGAEGGTGPTRALDRALQVWVYPESLESYTVSLDNRITATLDRQKAGQQSFSVAGVLFGFSADGWMSVATDCHALQMRVAQVCAEWEAIIPYGCQALVKVIPGEGIVDIIAPKLNVGTVRMRGCDRGYANILPGGMARFEQFNDQSYYIRGNGLVVGANADGQSFVLSPNTPPMVGGVLAETRRADGQAEMKRGSPVTPMLVRGDLGGEVTVVVGGQTVTLKGGGPQKVELPNGARLELTLNQVSRNLEWRVEKGYFDIQVEGIEGWRAIGLTGQGAVQQWDPGSQSVAVQNLTPASGDGVLDSVLVSPGRQMFVRITPQATFQYAKLEGSDVIATAAIGGAVTMYNAYTQQETDLSAKNMVWVGGRVDSGSGATVAGGHRMTVGGDPAGVEVAGELGGMNIAPGTAKSVQGDDGSRLEARADERGEVTLKASGGTFLLFTKLDPRVAIQLQPENQVIITIDMQRGVATIRGLEGNTPQGAAFMFVGGNEATGDMVRGGAVELRPGAPLTIAMERFGLTPEMQGTMVFYEAAGAGGSALTQAAAPVGRPWVTGRGIGSSFGVGGSDLDASRIAQPPVSTIR